MKRRGIVSKFCFLSCLVLLFFAAISVNSVRSSNTQSTGLRLQLCLVLDGSSSLTGADWNLSRDALANVVVNAIPHDGSVELAVVEFGFPSSEGYAQVVGTPTVVSGANYAALASQVRTLTQGGSDISTAAGIYLAWLALEGSPNFSPSLTHVINLITEHSPAVRNFNATSDLDGNGVVDGRDDAIAEMAAAAGSGLNELDVEGIGMDNSTAQWFQHNVVWPQVGIVAPPFSRAGWIRTFSDATEFASTVNQGFLAIVPEFPLLVMVPVFMAATLLAVVLRRGKSGKRTSLNGSTESTNRRIS